MRSKSSKRLKVTFHFLNWTGRSKWSKRLEVRAYFLNMSGKFKLSKLYKWEVSVLYFMLHDWVLQNTHQALSPFPTLYMYMYILVVAYDVFIIMLRDRTILSLSSSYMLALWSCYPNSIQGPKLLLLFQHSDQVFEQFVC